jgi:mannose/fructose/N-acetylgalactosamine-specific phosphotransferase system component IIC
MNPEHLLLLLGALLGWGTIVGLDLVSVPQGLLSRPLVAGAVAGWLVGDVEAGLRVGAVLELFALDVLPVGASRYPEYGPAAVGAVAAAAFLPPVLATGVGVLLGLVVALVAARTLDWLRHANARHVHRLTEELNTGSGSAIRRLQWAGIARDAARSAGVTALGLLLALVLMNWMRLEWMSPLLTPVLVGVGLASALHGALRTAGRGRRLAWLGLGVATGVLVVVGFGTLA